MNENPGGTPNPLNPSPEPIATPGAVRPNPPEAAPAPVPASAPTPRTSRPINRTMGVRPSVPGHPMSRPTQTPQANPVAMDNFFWHCELLWKKCTPEYQKEAFLALEVPEKLVR